jgi:hypothetical protein
MPTCSTKDVFITTCAHHFHQVCWNNYVNHQQFEVFCPICKTYQVGCKGVGRDFVVDVSTISIARIDDLTQNDVPIKPSGCSKFTVIMLILLIATVVVVPLTITMMKNTS